MSPKGVCDHDRIDDFVTGKLAQEQMRELEEHLSYCQDCQQRLDDLVAPRTQWSVASDALRFHSPEPEEQNLESRYDPCVRAILESLAPTDHPHRLGRLGTYEVSGVVGQGGMGAVLKGHDDALGRVVAIKVMAPHLASSSAARERFAREARSAAAITHDNVIDIYGVHESAGTPFLVMPYAGGTSLQTRIEKDGPANALEVCRIGHQIASGLAAAHAQGLVHRDIKPANILMRDGIDRLVITDFGLARAVDDASVTRTGMIAGTPHYMSPEQASGSQIDHRSDLFSLGSLLYTLCTGRPPFVGDHALGILRQVSDDPAPPISDSNPSIPLWLTAIIERLHEKDRGDRYQTASEVAGIFAECIAHLQDKSNPLPRGLHARASWQSKLRGGVFCSVLVAAAVVLIVHFRGTGVERNSSTPDSRQNSEATIVEPLAGTGSSTALDDPSESPRRLGNRPSESDLLMYEDDSWTGSLDPSINEIQLNAWRLSEQTLDPFGSGTQE